MILHKKNILDKYDFAEKEYGITDKENMVLQ